MLYPLSYGGPLGSSVGRYQPTGRRTETPRWRTAGGRTGPLGQAMFFSGSILRAPVM